MITEQDKINAIELIQEACNSGSRMKPACKTLGITIRTLQRWQKDRSLKDQRCGPLSEPANKFTDAERNNIIQTANSIEYRDLSPSQIVPSLADKKIYIGSESSFYRILKQEKMMEHRNASRPKKHKKPDELCATKPNQLWSWDITYLMSTVNGKYFYLYLFMDVFSRKIVAAEVHETQSAAYAADIVDKAYVAEGVKPRELNLHADNGGPMKGITMVAKLQQLGIMPSFSRPSVSDDNPFSESLFKTLKYCQMYPCQPFDTIEEARSWVCLFVNWYNNTHHHSGIKFVTPNSRHLGLDKEILAIRTQVYEAAKNQNPLRWSKQIRNWKRIEKVYLNPKHSVTKVKK